MPGHRRILSASLNSSLAAAEKSRPLDVRSISSTVSFGMRRLLVTVTPISYFTGLSVVQLLHCIMLLANLFAPTASPLRGARSARDGKRRQVARTPWALRHFRVDAKTPVVGLDPFRS